MIIPYLPDNPLEAKIAVMYIRKWSLIMAGQLVTGTYTGVTVVLRFWQAVMRKSSHFDFAIFKETYFVRLSLHCATEQQPWTG
jgi:hypothetical protein